MKYTSIEDAFKAFDSIEKKHFDFHHIKCELNKLPDSIKYNKECEYENIAMSLVPNVSNNAWGTYYGSQIKGEDKDGKPIEYPSFHSITSEAVSYWYKRSKKVKNPLLKARYLGLTWDFMKKVSKQSYPTDLYKIYVETLLDVVKEEYPSHPVITVIVCNRLFDLTKNSKDYLQKVKKVLFDFDDKYSTEKHDNSPCYWGMYVQLIITNPSLFTVDEKNHVIRRQEDRLNRLQNLISSTPSYFWTLKEQIEILAEFYKKENQMSNIHRVLLVLENAFDIVAKNMTGIQKIGNLEMIVRLYARFNLLKERENLLCKLEHEGSEAIKEMSYNKFEITYPVESLQQISDYLLQGTDLERIQRFCLFFIPNRNEQLRQLKDLAKIHPLQYIAQTQVLDEKGRPLSVINSIDKDIDGQLVLHITKMIQFQSVPLNHIIQELKSCGTLSFDNIMKMATASPILPASRYSVIETAFKSYFGGDYLVFCHLITPQIEVMVREFLEQSNRETIRPQKGNNGFSLRILDDMLRDEVIEQAFNKDIAYYFRISLTDQRGLNIRNSLCHGLTPPTSFGQLVADRLLHIFLLWMQVSNKEQ